MRNFSALVVPLSLLKFLNCLSASTAFGSISKEQMEPSMERRPRARNRRNAVVDMLPKGFLNFMITVFCCNFSFFCAIITIAEICRGFLAVFK